MLTPDRILARQRAADASKTPAPEPRRLLFGAPYGNSSSYTPATDACPTPFVPAADVYSPPPTDPTPDFDGGGGSFDGAGASGDY